MHAAERILLYATALTLGGFLLAGEPGDRPADREQRAQVVTSSDAPVSRPAPALASFEAHDVSAENVPVDANAPQPVRAGDALVLKDGAGRPRIELSVDDRGTARIVLNSQAGRPLIVLGAGPDHTGAIELKDRGRTAGLRLDEAGRLTMVLETGEKAGLRASAVPDGDVELTLTGTAGGRAKLQVVRTGETEMGVASGEEGIEALLRTDADGAAEIAVLDARRKGKASMSVVPKGDIGINVTGATGAEAVMQLFADGLAEIAIKDPDAKGGPHMVRLPNGVSAISARRADGSPAASMVAAPDGTSVLAATSQDGKNEAAFRIDAQGTARITLTEPGAAPKENPPPERRPARTPPAVLSIPPEIP